MKLRYKSNTSSVHSISVQLLSRPYLDMNWHFHKEFELAFVNKGEGSIIVGDYVGKFYTGDLFLIAPDLPHVFVNDKIIDEDGSVEMVFVKFTKLLSGVDIFKLPEFSRIIKLLKLSSQGIIFDSLAVERTAYSIMHLTSLEYGAEQLIMFFDILNQLASFDSYKLLSGVKSLALISSLSDERMIKIVDYVRYNYSTNIELNDIAEIVSMTPNSLCRYFKLRSSITLFDYIKEYRVNKACQLLIEDNSPMGDIGFSVGFQSITTFNRVFKDLTGLTPTEYRNSKLKLLKSHVR